MMKNSQDENNPKFKITLPNVMFIPLVSFVGIVVNIIRMCFGKETYNWLTMIFLYPFLIYVVWCVGWILIMMLSIKLGEMVKREVNNIRIRDGILKD